MKEFFKELVEHFSAMGNLDGKATDYPIMLTIYLGIFLLCFMILKQGQPIMRPEPEK